MILFVDSGVTLIVIAIKTQKDRICGLRARYSFTIDNVFHVDAALGHRCSIVITDYGNLEGPLEKSSLVHVADLRNLEKRQKLYGMTRVVKRIYPFRFFLILQSHSS